MQVNKAVKYHQFFDLVFVRYVQNLMKNVSFILIFVCDILKVMNEVLKLSI